MMLNREVPHELLNPTPEELNNMKDYLSRCGIVVRSPFVVIGLIEEDNKEPQLAVEFFGDRLVATEVHFPLGHGEAGQNFSL